MTKVKEAQNGAVSTSEERQQAFLDEYHDLCKRYGFRLMPTVNIAPKADAGTFGSDVMIKLPVNVGMNAVPIEGWQPDES